MKNYLSSAGVYKKKKRSIMYFCLVIMNFYSAYLYKFSDKKTTTP